MDRLEKEHILFESILLLANKMQTLGDKQLQTFTLKQWFLLTMMTRMDQEAPTVKEIAEYTGTSRQNVKQMLELLEKNGYVKLEKSKRDGRALNVLLTDKCRIYFEENTQEGDWMVQALFNDIPEADLDITLNVFHALFVRALTLMKALDNGEMLSMVR